MPRVIKPSKKDINVLPCRFAAKPEYRFVVTGPQPGGRRWRKFFASRPQADAYAHLRRVELANVGTEGAALSASQRAEYLDCLAKLEPYGVTLREAVEMLLPGLAARRQTVPVERAVAVMLKTKKEDGVSRRHLEDLRSRLGQFADAFSERPLAGFSTAELDLWVRGLGVAGQTRNNFRRVLASLFAFGRTRGWCTENPASALERAKGRKDKVGEGRKGRILTPEQTAALLNNAPADCIAPLAIWAFCGLRRSEIERLNWREVRMLKKEVEVEFGKTGAAHRFVPIRDNLLEWLRPFVRKEGPVCPPNWRKRFDAARRAAGLGGKAWPHNTLRHGFASYHAAQFQDAGKLANDMGHTSPTVVFRHYREAVESDTAARYWSIRPTATPANVVPTLGVGA